MAQVIYMITNKIDNKKYIGASQKDYKKRWNAHIKGYTKCWKLCNALKKYGVDNFIFEVIFETTDETINIFQIEKNYIKQYDSFGPNGYNLTEGGEGIYGYKHTAETRKIIREKRALQTFSPEQCEIHRQHGLKGSASYNKRFTEETKSKLSESQSQRMKNGYNPKATKWIVRDNHNRTQEICNPTTHFGKSFKSFWVSHKKKAPIQKGAFKDWQLLEIIKI